MSGGILKTPFQAAADALYARVAALMSSTALDVWENPPEEPAVTCGHPRNVRPFHVWVDLLPSAVTSEGSATTGEIKLSFTLHVYCVAKHSDRETAVDYLQKYMASAIYGVCADATLNRAVGNVIPRISDTGVDVDESGKWIAAGAIEMRCSVFSICPHAFREVIND